MKKNLKAMCFHKISISLNNIMSFIYFCHLLNSCEYFCEKLFHFYNSEFLLIFTIRIVLQLWVWNYPATISSWKNNWIFFRIFFSLITILNIITGIIFQYFNNSTIHFFGEIIFHRMIRPISINKISK